MHSSKATTKTVVMQHKSQPKKDSLRRAYKLKRARVVMELWNYLTRVTAGEVTVKAIFMHDPFGLFTSGSSAFVENKSLLHPKKCSSTTIGAAAVNFSVFPSSFPVPSSCCSVCSQPCWVFPVSQAEKVPFSLPHFRYVCITQKLAILNFSPTVSKS